MNYPVASSRVSPRGIILFAASGGEFNPERFKFSKTQISAPHRHSSCRCGSMIFLCIHICKKVYPTITKVNIYFTIWHVGCEIEN